MKNLEINWDNALYTILFFLVFLVVLFGNSSDLDRTVRYTGESRFLELPLPYDKENSYFKILVDKQTRVEYLYYEDSYSDAGGLTPLLDKNGNISYYEGKIE